jgi:hypothetical protein
MTICKTVDTPLSVSEKLSITDDKVLSSEDSTRYMSIVGVRGGAVLGATGALALVHQPCAQGKLEDI